MALFGRRRSGTASGPSSGVTALVKASTMATDEEHTRGVTINHHVQKNALNAINLGSIPHILTLEVTIPGEQPFEVTREYKVPARATGRSGYTLPPGVVLPVIVRDAATHDVAIDWDAFLASPDRKAAVRRAAADESSRQAQRYTESVPGLKQQTWASAAQGLPMWVNAVRTGSMKRKAFDQQINTLLRLGQIDPAQAEQAKRELDADGF
jgi:hypothetical protein